MGCRRALSREQTDIAGGRAAAAGDRYIYVDGSPVSERRLAEVKGSAAGGETQRIPILDQQICVNAAEAGGLVVARTSIVVTEGVETFRVVNGHAQRAGG